MGVHVRAIGTQYILVNGVTSTVRTSDPLLPLISNVMAGLVPAISRSTSGTDGRDKPGYDGESAVDSLNSNSSWHKSRLRQCRRPDSRARVDFLNPSHLRRQPIDRA
jgi:hypothetical protein